MRGIITVDYARCFLTCIRKKKAAVYITGNKPTYMGNKGSKPPSYADIDAATKGSAVGTTFVEKKTKGGACYNVNVIPGRQQSGSGSGSSEVLLRLSFDIRLYDRQVASLIQSHGNDDVDDKRTDKRLAPRNNHHVVVAPTTDDIVLGPADVSDAIRDKVIAYMTDFSQTMLRNAVAPPPPFSDYFGMGAREHDAKARVGLTVADEDETESGFVYVAAENRLVVHTPLIRATRKYDGDAATKKGGVVPLEVDAAVLMAHHLALAFPYGLVPILDPLTQKIEKLTERLDLDVTTVILRGVTHEVNVEEEDTPSHVSHASHASHALLPLPSNPPASRRRRSLLSPRTWFKGKEEPTIQQGGGGSGSGSGRGDGRRTKRRTRQ